MGLRKLYLAIMIRTKKNKKHLMSICPPASVRAASTYTRLGVRVHGRKRERLGGRGGSEPAVRTVPSGPPAAPFGEGGIRPAAPRSELRA